MKLSDLETLIAQTHRLTTDLLLKKGNEYSTDADRLCNFKLNAEKLGTKPLLVWSIYFNKHIESINNFVNKANKTSAVGASSVLSEPIEGRFHDAINYLYLGLALVTEQMQDEREKPKNAHLNGPENET